MSVTIGKYYIEWKGFDRYIWFKHKAHIGYAVEYIVTIMFLDFRILKEAGVRGVVK